MEQSQLSEFGIILLFIVGAIIFVSLAFFVSRLIRPHRPNEEKLTSYECGEDPVGNGWGQFNVRFYIIALVFILFEVEVLFLFPWATVFGDQGKIEATQGLWGWFALSEMFTFLALLALGLAYAWGKGFLDWVKPSIQVQNYDSPVPLDLYEQLNKKYEAGNSDFISREDSSPDGAIKLVG